MSCRGVHQWLMIYIMILCLKPLTSCYTVWEHDPRSGLPTPSASARAQPKCVCVSGYCHRHNSAAPAQSTTHKATSCYLSAFHSARATQLVRFGASSHRPFFDPLCPIRPSNNLQPIVPSRTFGEARHVDVLVVLAFIVLDYSRPSLVSRRAAVLDEALQSEADREAGQPFGRVDKVYVPLDEQVIDGAKRLRADQMRQPGAALQACNGEDNFVETRTIHRTHAQLESHVESRQLTIGTLLLPRRASES
jgi:hypothetical protein